MTKAVHKTWLVRCNFHDRGPRKFDVFTSRDDADKAATEYASKPHAGMVSVYECVSVVEALPPIPPVLVVPFIMDAHRSSEDADDL